MEQDFSELPMLPQKHLDKEEEKLMGPSVRKVVRGDKIMQVYQ
jgi:hypothetical protein